MSIRSSAFRVGFDFSSLIKKIVEKKINAISFISIPILIILIWGITYFSQLITGIGPDKLSSGHLGINENIMFGWLYLYLVGLVFFKEYLNIYFILGSIQSVFLILCRALVVFLIVQVLLFVGQLFFLKFTPYNVKQIMTYDNYFEIIPILFCYGETIWFFRCYMKKGLNRF